MAIEFWSWFYGLVIFQDAYRSTNQSTWRVRKKQMGKRKETVIKTISVFTICMNCAKVDINQKTFFTMRFAINNHLSNAQILSNKHHRHIKFRLERDSFLMMISLCSVSFTEIARFRTTQTHKKFERERKRRRRSVKRLNTKKQTTQHFRQFNSLVCLSESYNFILYAFINKLTVYIIWSHVIHNIKKTSLWNWKVDRFSSLSSWFNSKC